MQTHTPITLESKPALAWNAPSRPHVQRTKHWYVTAGIVVLVIISYAIFTASWTLAIVSAIAAGMYALVHNHLPPTSSIELHDSGVLFNGDFMRWEQLLGFWFLHTKDYIELRLVPRRGSRRVVIQLGTLDPVQLRMVLGQRIPELAHTHESLIDIFIRICKL